MSCTGRVVVHDANLFSIDAEFGMVLLSMVLDMYSRLVDTV